jgi:peptidoglycan/LPS O-acetylase OafA/YrhL
MLSAGLTVVAMTFAAAIFSILHGGRFANLVSIRLLRTAGKYSYGAYVIHGLIAPAMAKLLPTGLWIGLAGQSLLSILVLACMKTTVSFVLAWVSWHALEAPFLQLKGLFQPDRIDVNGMQNTLLAKRTRQ